MSTLEMAHRVLIVDDNRDGADALGLLAEAFGNQVHVTYGGTQALDVAAAFRPDLMLIDLAMPDMDGCLLAKRFRQIPAFASTKIVAVTGHADQGHKNLAVKAGFDGILAKPVALDEIKAVLTALVTTHPIRVVGTSRTPTLTEASQRLPIGEARRIRAERKSKTLTEVESEAAICDGVARFQEEYMGWRSAHIQVRFIKDLLLIRNTGSLTLAERQLGKSPSHENGRDLIKQTRKQLLELARPMLESLVHEVAGVKVVSMHHDISTKTGEEMIVFSMVTAPHFS